MDMFNKFSHTRHISYFFLGGGGATKFRLLVLTELQSSPFFNDIQ